jgi:hypothetical protein
VAGNFCFGAEVVFDATGALAGTVCTDVQADPRGADTGLSFAVIDRGGNFPDPASGPGLLNGIPISYAVTSYSVNTGDLVIKGLTQDQLDLINPATPPAELSLESGLAPLLSATPRTNSSSFVNASAEFEALVPGTDDTCDTSQPAAAVVPETGEYIDFLPCSNALTAADLVLVNDVNIPSGTFFLVIDSITDAPNPYAGGYGIADGGNRVWFHWEDESGALPAALTPNPGFFDLDQAFAHTSEVRVFFGFDTDPTATGVDLGINAAFVADYSAMEDLVVNGQGVHLEQLGTAANGLCGTGTAHNERRPHCVEGSSLADMVVIGNVRSLSNGREYAFPGQFAMGASSFELTWEVNGGVYGGTMRSLNGGLEIPKGGQPKGPANPSTFGDFIAGYNWGFIGPGDPATVRTGVFPNAFPLTNEMNLNIGDTFALFVPGHSVYIEGIRDLPETGDTWRILLDSGSDRGQPDGFGRAGRGENRCVLDGTDCFYSDRNGSSQGNPSTTSRAIVGAFPGMRWKLTLSGGSNDLANADLSEILVVPNPFIAQNEITRGRGLQRIQFTNMPPQATVRIYTISGNLVRVLEHSGGSGTLEWDVRTRFDLFVASGNYYFHVTTPDGRTSLGRFAVIN